jgi:hypothetical protein
MRTLNLSQTVAVILAGAEDLYEATYGATYGDAAGTGYGTVTLGPSLPGTIWTPQSCSIITSSNNSGTTAFALYQNLISSATYIGGSASGNFDTASLDITLYPGQFLLGVWSNGDPGALAVLTIYGLQVIP